MNSKQFSLQRIELPKRPLNTRRIHFIEIYEPVNATEAQSQAKRCLACGSPYCEWKCPVHNPISKWLKLAAEGRIIEAAELSHQSNSLPEVCGRVCPQDKLCEAACVLHDDFGAVTIGHVERYINDTAFQLGWRPDISNVKISPKHVAIIGAGPAGLACADVLARHGIQSTVFDKHPEIGGLLTFGIPEFKLEKHIMARRHEIFATMGIKFQLETEIGVDIHFDSLIQNYDAIFIGTGSYHAIQGQLKTQQAIGAYNALPFLIANTRHLMGFPELPHMPYVNLSNQCVVVLGGGDTAMDCARTAIRQGANRVICVYRREKSAMPGSPREVENAQEEGVQFYFNAQATNIAVNSKGCITGINICQTQNGECINGCYQIELIEKSDFMIEADAIITAFGFQPHTMDWLSNHLIQRDPRGRIIIDQGTEFSHQTSNEKIFAGGDAVRGSDLVVTAIADGRSAAEGIILFLGT